MGEGGMKKKWANIGICSAALILFLTWGILPKISPSNGSRYSRKVEENFFSLEMERLNCTVEEPLSLNKGDVIDVSITHVSGELALFIGERDREPIYEGNNPKLNYFRVTIPKEGEYLLSVSGKQAKGSISFQIDRAENK